MIYAFYSLFSFIRGIKNILIGFFFLGFFLSILANFVSPDTCKFISPFGLLFLPLLLIDLVIILVYFKRNIVVAAIAILLFVFSINFLPRIIQYPKEQSNEGLKVMSWNVKNFDLYNWTKNIETRQNILRLIDTVDADVLCLQEFFTNDFEHDNIQSLQKIGYTYYYFFPAFSQEHMGNQWGLAIFSKHPLTDYKSNYISQIRKQSTNQCMSARLKFKGKIYTIYNAHFQSVHLEYEDYDYMNDIKKDLNMVEWIKSYRIFEKVFGTYEKRNFQVNEFLTHYKKNSSQNSILCADLNDAPNSYAYHQLSKKMKDAFVEKGQGFSNTISISLLKYRIDYLFTSKDINVKSYQRIKTNLSDHHILISYLK